MSWDSGYWDSVGSRARGGSSLGSTWRSRMYVLVSDVPLYNLGRVRWLLSYKVRPGLYNVFVLIEVREPKVTRCLLALRTTMQLYC